MRRFRTNWLCMAACGALLAGALLAGEAALPVPPTPPDPNAAAVRFRHISPVEKFRGLLGMTPAEQERALAGKSPADKKILLAKLQEYEALPRAVREARLCQTELHWEMALLMKLAPAARSNQLDEVSALYRPMVEDLLRQWDRMPAARQKALLEQQGFIGLYLRMQGRSPAAQQAILATLAPERQARWMEEMNRWQALPAAERTELCAQFQQFFSLSEPERAETVNTLPDPQRKDTEKALREFGSLSPSERAQCIASFRKFAALGPAEQAQFLENAARWHAMKPRQRKLWRELVNRLPPAPPGFSSDLPPAPPGFQERAIGLPPMPPDVTAPVVIARSPGS